MKKLLAVTIIVLFIGASVVPSISGNFKKMKDESGSVALDNSLIGCWHFDEGSGNIAYDSSGHNNNGTIYSASWVGGISGKALWFDGYDDYVRIHDTNDFDFVNQSFTFFTWVKILNNADEWRMFICLGDIDGPPVVYLGKCRSGYQDGRIIFRVFNSAYQDATCLSIDGGDALPKNQWMHVAGVVNYESNLITLYVNGNVQESQSLVSLNLSEAQNLRLLFGNYSRPDTTYEHHHYGPMDEVHIYNRALNDTEILEYYEDYFPISTVYVDDDYNESTPGWGYDHFDSIQDGVDGVNESGTVYVYNGTYYENVVIDKTINLIGEDKNSTIIESAGYADVVYIAISADWVNITGFTIKNAEYNCNGIGVRSNFNSIFSNNIVSNDYFGVYFYGSNNNIISDNNISENGAQGLRLELSSFNMICENRITQNLDDGIALNYDSNNNTVINNCIAVNVDDGIQIYSSNTNLILKNEIIENIETGIQITENSNNNQLYHNNILNNTLQANDLCNSFWDNGYPSGGNYWDDYTGDDLYSGPNQDIPGPDGIGDSPYNISGGDNQDNYPLMHHFELYYILNISAPPEVNEGELFNVVVTSMGGPVVPNATVDFNDELKLTDSDGRAYFTAPQVGEDTYYDIIANKEGYTGDSETILVKDVPVEFVSTFIFGRIDNLTTGGDVITFEAVNIRCVTLLPLTINAYKSGELITISKNPKGFVGALFGVQLIFALCSASI